MKRVIVSVLMGVCLVGMAWADPVTGTLEVQCQNPSGNGLDGHGTFAFYTKGVERVSFACQGSEVYTIDVELEALPRFVRMESRMRYQVGERWERIKCAARELSWGGEIAKARVECWAGEWPGLPFNGDCTKFTWQVD